MHVAVLIHRLSSAKEEHLACRVFLNNGRADNEAASRCAFPFVTSCGYTFGQANTKRLFDALESARLELLRRRLGAVRTSQVAYEFCGASERDV